MRPAIWLSRSFSWKAQCNSQFATFLQGTGVLRGVTDPRLAISDSDFSARSSPFIHEVCLHKYIFNASQQSAPALRRERRLRSPNPRDPRLKEALPGRGWASAGRSEKEPAGVRGDLSLPRRRAGGAEGGTQGEARASQAGAPRERESSYEGELPATARGQRDGLLGVPAWTSWTGTLARRAGRTAAQSN